ncbi:hypothetical protein [Winogradskyella sp.]|uniref:hypothetical protein n=1 Tax=Winogradskyella sp. TaxID=1883156 RepID=UPI00260FE5F3|nr:hypothetical protein [Winogradskyella sp.]
MKNIIYITALIICSSMASAQTGVGTLTPDPDAALEVSATDKGLLLPRIALTNSTLAAPLSAHKEGMAVYNTATAGDVTPGYYYNDGTQWVRVGSGTETVTTLVDNGDGTYTYTSEDGTVSNITAPEPWYGTDDNAAATDNTEDIYTMGNVGIATETPSHNLDIAPLTGATSLRLKSNNTGGVNLAAKMVFENAHPLRSSGIHFVDNSTPNRQFFIGKAYSGSPGILGLSISATNTGEDVTQNRSSTNTPLFDDLAIYVHQNADVAIGALDPTDKLDVNGTVRVRDLPVADANDVLVVADEVTGQLRNGGALSVLGNTSVMTQVVTGNEIATHDDGTGNVVSIQETVTTMVDNGNGTYTYTSEDGTTTTTATPGAETVTTLVDNGDGTFTYTSENATSTTFDANETVTTFVDNGNGTYTYTSEDGTTTTTAAPGAETVTTLVDNGNGTFTYTSENATSTTFDANETVTTLVNNGNGTYTYTSENGTATTVNTNDLEPWFGSDDNGPATDNTEDIYALGNVGIGTTTPATDLNISKATGSTCLIQNTSNGTGGSYTSASGDGGIVLRRPQDAASGGVNGYINFAGTNDTGIHRRIYYDEASDYISVGYDGLSAAPSLTSVANFVVPPGTSGGNVGIGTVAPTEKLDVVGNIKASGNLQSGTTTYPDYVFEDYVDGESTINKDYNFSSIEEVDAFIKLHKHLPGVTSIGDLEKTEEGYSVNITALSVQTLEKVEELFLHTIAQQKQILKLEKENQALEQRLIKIEKALGIQN